MELLEGGYYREAALRRVEVLRQQKAAAKDEDEKQKIEEKAQQRISAIEQKMGEGPLKDWTFIVKEGRIPDFGAKLKYFWGRFSPRG